MHVESRDLLCSPNLRTLDTDVQLNIERQQIRLVNIVPACAHEGQDRIFGKGRPLLFIDEGLFFSLAWAAGNQCTRPGNSVGNLLDTAADFQCSFTI